MVLRRRWLLSRGNIIGGVQSCGGAGGRREECGVETGDMYGSWAWWWMQCGNAWANLGLLRGKVPACNCLSRGSGEVGAKLVEGLACWVFDGVDVDMAPLGGGLLPIVSCGVDKGRAKGREEE